MHRNCGDEFLNMNSCTCMCVCINVCVHFLQLMSVCFFTRVSLQSFRPCRRRRKWLWSQIRAAVWCWSVTPHRAPWSPSFIGWTGVSPSPPSLLSPHCTLSHHVLSNFFYTHTHFFDFIILWTRLLVILISLCVFRVTSYPPQSSSRSGQGRQPVLRPFDDQRQQRWLHLQRPVSVDTHHSGKGAHHSDSHLW